MPVESKLKGLKKKTNKLTALQVEPHFEISE